MDSRAIEKAESRLRIAKKAVLELSQCKNFLETKDAWYTFLSAAKNIYTVLEQGAKVSAQSRQWFGAKNNERKNDELLQYLYQARNDEEHGLASNLEFVPGGVGIGVFKEGYSRSFQFTGGTDASGNLFGTATSLDGKPVLIERRVATAKLIPVTGRGHITFNPPASHLGNLILDPTPVGVAELAIDYLASLVTEAGLLA